MDREAKIKLIAEGASRAQAETNRTADAVGNIGTKAGLASGALQELGRVAFRIASDAARAFNDVRPIEFGKAGDQARQFSDQIARYAQRFGADAGSMRSQFMQVGESIGATSDRVAGFARSLSEITSTDAAGAVRDLGEYANQTGRELEEVTEIGGTLVVSGASASARKFISTVDSGGLAVPYGVLVQDLSPFGVAHSAADGTLLHHANIAPHPSTPKPSTGRYTLILQTCPPSCTALSDGDPAPITLLVSVNDPAETGRGDTFLYRGNAWAKKQTLSGLPKVVIDIATVAQGISAGSLTKSLADMPFSIAVWA